MTVVDKGDEGRLRALLDSLGYDREPSILIVGWATNARVGGEISHDIDLTLDAHISTKIAALIDRYDTEKGKKDARELVALIDKGGTAAGVIDGLLAASDGPAEDVPTYIRQMFELLPKVVDLGKKGRVRYAALAREWTEEADLKVQAQSRRSTT